MTKADLLNDIDFDHPSLHGVPNLVWARKKGVSAPEAEKQVSENLRDFAIAAAKKFRKWLFVAANELPNGYQHLAVYQEREYLGGVYYTLSRKGVKVIVTSSRIAAKSKYKKSVETIDHKKALRVMAKSFGVKTPEERVTEASGLIGSKLYTHSSVSSSLYNNALSYLNRHLEEYILNNFDAVLAEAVAAGASREKVSNIPELRDNMYTISKIHVNFNSSKGLTVVLFGDQYILSDHKTPPLVVGNHLLPEYVRRKVGMLKLVDDGVFIADVGYRLNSTTFFVENEESHKE